MKTKYLFYLICLFLSLGLVTQCEKYGPPDRGDEVDDDSDRPPWAGGNTSENPHKKPGQSGGSPGVDYGDQVMIDRDINGVAVLHNMIIEGEEVWIVKAVDEDGELLPYNEEGELVNPEDAVEVDLGRLNIVKAPDAVSDQAFREAMKVLGAEGAVITRDFCGRLTATTYNEDGTVATKKTNDSPRESMALYKYIMQNLFIEPAQDESPNQLAFLGAEPYNFNPLDIAASCFAAGSDKTGYVDIDEVAYINGMTECFGINPILNEYPYTDEEGEEELSRDGSVRQYFDFGQSGVAGGEEYRYTREFFETKWIQYLVDDDGYHPVDPVTGLSDGDIVMVRDAMEGLDGPDAGVNKFTYMMTNAYESRVKGFSWAVDDAVQVLDYVHGDSNIRFVDEFGNPL